MNYYLDEGVEILWRIYQECPEVLPKAEALPLSPTTLRSMGYHVVTQQIFGSAESLASGNKDMKTFLLAPYKNVHYDGALWILSAPTMRVRGLRLASYCVIISSSYWADKYLPSWVASYVHLAKFTCAEKIFSSYDKDLPIIRKFERIPFFKKMKKRNDSASTLKETFLSNPGNKDGAVFISPMNIKFDINSYIITVISTACNVYIFIKIIGGVIYIIDEILEVVDNNVNYLYTNKHKIKDKFNNYIDWFLEMWDFV